MPKSIWVAFLLISAYILMSANISGLDIYSLDEARNAGCAREMMEKKDLVVPTFNYQLREQKPPLHYYFMILGYLLFGFGEFAARFFSVIAGVLSIYITYVFAARYLDEQSARWASVVLLVSTHFSIQIHMAVPDPYLIFFGTAGTFALFIGHKEKKWLYLLLGYVAIALAVLCKGPIGMVMPGLGVFLYLVFSKRFTWKNILSFRPFIGFVLMLGVALPWYFAVHFATKGAWTEAFFFTQNFQRFGNAMEGHGGIFLLTWAFVFIGLLPFGIYLGQSLWKAWQDRHEHHQVLLYCLMQGGGILLIFSISQTKLPNYTVPLYPFWSILIGYYVANFKFTAQNKWSRQISTWFYALITVALPIGLYIALSVDKTLGDYRNLALYFSFLPFTGVLALVFLYQKRFSRLLVTQAASFALLSLIFFHIAFPPIDRENPVYFSRQKMDLEAPLFAYRMYNPAFVFYAQKEVKVLNDWKELKKELQKHPKAYVISRDKNLDSLALLPNIQLLAKRKDIFEIPTTIVMEKN